MKNLITLKWRTLRQDNFQVIYLASFKGVLSGELKFVIENC